METGHSLTLGICKVIWQGQKVINKVTECQTSHLEVTNRNPRLLMDIKILISCLLVYWALTSSKLDLWYAGIIMGMGSANERGHYFVIPSLIDPAHTQNDPWYAFTTLVDMLYIDILPEITRTTRMPAFWDPPPPPPPPPPHDYPN